ncbi:MAG: signal peptidase I [Patescibacteria group bacterium]|nr:signal peptidase I [Patescibacteria group bacterium]
MIWAFVKAVFFFVMEILETIVFIGSLFIVLYLFIVQPNQVKGVSMDYTFASGDYIFTSKITYKFRDFQRGDVIVFRSPKNPDIEYIKRIIGLPGDTVTVAAQEVYVNNRKLDEPYIASKTVLWENGFTKDGIPYTIPEGHLYVMGDNRPRSSDSREFGPIPIESVIGQVFYRYLPITKQGFIENPFPEDIRRSLSNNPNVPNYLSLKSF